MKTSRDYGTSAKNGDGFPGPSGAEGKGVEKAGGFSLIEAIAVVAIVGILAVLLVPSVIRETDQGTLNQEAANLNSFSNALVLDILQTCTIPNAAGMASAIASNLPVPVNQITTNTRNFTRSFLVDPNLQINGSTLPYVQTTNGTTQPFSARVMIVSTLGTSNPPFSTVSQAPTANFNDMWNTPPNTKPATWSTWNGNGYDVVIQRINLQPLFYQLILNTQDLTNNIAQFSINATNTASVPTNGTGWNSYYLSGSVVRLWNSNVVAATSYVLTRNISFVFQNGAWNGQTEYITVNTNTPTNSATAFATAATNFFVSRYNASGADSGSGKGADEASVLGAMANFMVDYTIYANQSPAFAIPGTLTGMSQLTDGSAQNVITYTGNGHGSGSGILTQ